MHCLKGDTPLDSFNKYEMKISEGGQGGLLFIKGGIFVYCTFFIHEIKAYT